jgi:hypothetical protein
LPISFTSTASAVGWSFSTGTIVLASTFESPKKRAPWIYLQFYHRFKELHTSVLTAYIVWLFHNYGKFYRMISALLLPTVSLTNAAQSFLVCVFVSGYLSRCFGANAHLKCHGK